MEARGTMRLRIWRELVSQGRRGRGLEQARLFLEAILSIGHGVWGPLSLAPAARGHRIQAGGTVHQAQPLMCAQGLAPPQQLGLQALDLLPQQAVVFLQRLMLLEAEADRPGRGCQPALGSQQEPCTLPPGTLT